MSIIQNIQNLFFVNKTLFSDENFLEKNLIYNPDFEQTRTKF